MQVFAPWTDEQVAAIQRWQDNKWVHPLTCKHHSGEPLKVTREGLRCDHKGCDYTQDWVPQVVFAANRLRRPFHGEVE